MKVYLEGKNEPRILNESSRQAKKSENVARKSGIRQQDRVHLSKDAQRFREAGFPVPGGEKARLERLENIRSMIQAGTYAPDSESVAERMLSQALSDSLEG